MKMVARNRRSVAAKSRRSLNKMVFGVVLSVVCRLTTPRGLGSIPGAGKIILTSFSGHLSLKGGVKPVSNITA